MISVPFDNFGCLGKKINLVHSGDNANVAKNAYIIVIIIVIAIIINKVIIIVINCNSKQYFNKLTFYVLFNECSGI